MTPQAIDGPSDDDGDDHDDHEYDDEDDQDDEDDDEYGIRRTFPNER